MAPLVISRRAEGLWVIDGNHRRFIAFEKGMLQLPAMVHSGLTRQREADLYTKLGTVLGQTPWTRFQSKIAAGDDAAADIVKIAQRHGIEINGGTGKGDGRIVAVGRTEWIYARGGPEGLNWVLGFLAEAFDAESHALSEITLEGVFMFYARYADKISRSEAAKIMGPPGFWAWDARATGLWDRVDVGRRSNTYGLAIQEYVNDVWGKQGKRAKQLLPRWEASLGQFGNRFRDVAYGYRSTTTQWRTTQGDGRNNSAPQQLG